MLSQPLRLNDQCNSGGPDLTHISCFVWDSPPQLIHGAGLIIFVFFFVVQLVLAGHLFGRSPRGLLSLFKCPLGDPRDAENKLVEENQQQLLIGQWNLSRISPVCFVTQLRLQILIVFITSPSAGYF